MPIPPAGAFPVGDPITLPLAEKPRPALFLADAIDPATGEYRSILKGVDPVEAAALDALRIRRGSGSAVLDEGNNFHSVRSNDESLPLVLRQEIEWAWRRLIAARWIELVDVTIEQDDVAAMVVIAFRNLARQSTGRFRQPLELMQGVA